jgi:pilus assembly protein Flp/PilA
VQAIVDSLNINKGVLKMDVVPLLRILSMQLLRRDRRAVTALEYGIIAGVLGLVLIAVFKSFGSRLSTLFTSIGNSI